MKHPVPQRIFLLQPQGLLDTTSARVTAHAGQQVQKTQPAGCPRNGTRRQCYVQTLDGEFIGLVNQASLVPTKRTMIPVDRAREARDRRSHA